MFAYCGNNPALNQDSSGRYYHPAKIHDFVLEDIVEKHPTTTKDGTYIEYKTPVKRPFRESTYGFCDLYDKVTGEVWEAKRFGSGRSTKKVVAQIQLHNYVYNGILVADPGLDLKIGGTHTHISANVFTKADVDGEGMYIIGYWDDGGGIIYYDYQYVPSAKETFGAIAYTAAAVFSIFCLVVFGTPSPGIA